MIGLLLFIVIASADDTPASAPSGIEVQVSTVDGRTLMKELETTARVRSNSTLATFPVDQILSITPAAPAEVPPDKPTAWIELTNGSQLTATECSIEGKVTHLSIGLGTTDISTALIHQVRFSPPDVSKWPANVGVESKGDLLVVRKKDQLDFMEGTIGNIDDNRVIIKVDGENYPVNRPKVDGIIFYHQTTEKLDEPMCVVETSSGCRVKVKDLAFTPIINNGNSEIAVWGATQFGNSIAIPWKYVTKLDFSAGKIGYLSDLEPVSVQWTPYLDFGDSVPAMAEFYAPRRDEGREHQPLRLAGKEYDKGMSLYPRTAIEYRVPSGMKKFKAAAGIDDAVRETGNARLAISADGKTLFDRTIRGKDVPVDLDLDISGAKRLSILVDFGDQFDAGDFLDLTDARMVK